MQPQRPHTGLQHGIKRNLGRTWAVEISANTFGKNEFSQQFSFLIISPQENDRGLKF